MKLLAPLLVVSALFSTGTAQSITVAGLPAPSHKRIVVHGADCVVYDEAVCPEAVPLLDEAAVTVGDDDVVVVRTVATADGDSAAADALSPASALALRDYLVGAGVTRAQVSIDESCGDVELSGNASVPVEVQVSQTAE